MFLQNGCQCRTQTTVLAYVHDLYVYIRHKTYDKKNYIAGNNGDAPYRIHSDCISYSLLKQL